MSSPACPGSGFGWRVVLAALCMGAGPACAGDDAAPSAQSSAATAMASDGATGGEGTVADDGQNTADDATAGEGADGTATGLADTTGGGSVGDTSAAETAAQGVCDPPSIPFAAQASVSIDAATGTCTVAEGTGTDPQLLFDLRDTGLIDLTAMGLMISTSSSGTYINSTNIVGISPEFPVTVEATLDGGGAVTIDFEILQTGPVLFAEVVFS